MDKPDDNDRKYHIIARLQAKGVKDAFVVSEMLDSFDPVVCRKMQESPSRSLDDALEATINDAHKDFRIPGIYPIVNYYRSLVKKKYRTVYRTELKKMISRPLYLLAALVVFVVSYKGYFMTDKNFRVWEFNGMFTLMLAVLLLFSVFTFLKFSLHGTSTDIIRDISNKDYWLLFIIIITQTTHITNTAGLMVVASLNAIGWVYVLFTSFAKYATLVQARENIAFYIAWKKNVSISHMA